VVSTLAGTGQVSGCQNNGGSRALLETPVGLTKKGDHLFVTESYTGHVRYVCLIALILSRHHLILTVRGTVV
jgi:hypothetical protein